MVEMFDEQSADTAPATTAFDPGIVGFAQFGDLAPCDPAGLWSTEAPAGVCREAGGGSQQFFRYAPAFIDDPDGTGLFAGLAGAIYRSPPALLAAIPDALVFGYRTIAAAGAVYQDQTLTADDQVATYIEKLSREDGFSNEDSGLRRIERTRHFWLDGAARPTRTIEGAVISLCSTEPSNYGSFIFRVLPKLATLRNLGCPDFPVLVYARNPSTMRLLELAGVAPTRVVQHDPLATTRVGRVIAPSLRNPDSYLDRETKKFYATLRDRFGGPPTGRRLYVSRYRHGRVATTGRVMANEAALIERLSNIGFDVIEPETLSAEDQIRVFSSASMVVGPSGSGMFNCVFCHPGTAVIDIESEPDWIYAHTGLFSSCELDYGIFVGQADASDPADVHRRWSVTIDRLLDRIASHGG